jgi:uncharacterized protein YdhG (YjbR/CyaY superfamily)
MTAAKSNFQSVDEYIATFPKDVQLTLQTFRQAIKVAVPEAEEVISYQIPAYKYHGMIMYFSAYKEHYSISCPPPFEVFEVFKDQLVPYVVSKSAVQFPKSKPVPFELISEMAKFNAKENEKKSKAKKS